MAVYFTADTHFGHDNIIKYCKRPFHNAAEMNETIFAAWTALVRKDDTVYHLGDVAFGSEEAVARIVERIKNLPGRKFLIPGNHDHRYPELLARAFDEVLPPLWEMSAPVGGGETARIALCHYPLLTWKGAFRGALHFHGHVHGRIPENKRRIDVGVDAWGFAPARLESIVQRMRSAPDWVNPEPGRGDEDED